MIMEFINSLIMDAVFPAIFILSIFAVFSYKLILKSEIIHFLIVGFLVSCTIRVFAPSISGRYNIPLALYFIIFSVLGFPLLVAIIQRITQKKIPAVPGIHITTFLILIIVISCIGKALSSPDSKTYIHDMIGIIKSSSKEPVLLFNDTKEASRIAYHAGVSRYYSMSALIDPDLKNLGKALEYMKNKNLKPYVIVEQTDSEFRDFFKSRNLPFPLKLIKQFHEKHQRFCIYELDENIASIAP